MATLPDPETLALKVLSIFVNQYHCRPGGALRLAVFLSAWPKLGYPMDDFARGAEFAEAQGWLEEAPQGFRITEAGFAKAGGIIPTADASARQVLSLCVNHFMTRPNGLVMVKNLHLIWQTRLHHKADELASGVDLCIENGWLEDAGNGMSLRLTEAGFAEA